MIMGHFPQAFTPLAVISAAFNLDRALDSHGVCGSLQSAKGFVCMRPLHVIVRASSWMRSIHCVSAGA